MELDQSSGDWECREEFAKITRDGIYYHPRQPNFLEMKKYSQSDYAPYPDCLGFM